MILSRLRVQSAIRPIVSRAVSTLSSNPHIKVFPNPARPSTYILTYLDTQPPSEGLAIGISSSNPPTPKTFAENHRFLSILNEVLKHNAHNDQDLISQAQAFASPAGATLGSGGAHFHGHGPSRSAKGPRTTAGRGGGGGGGGGTGAGGASAQGGAGGGGVGGFVHLNDTRNPPDFGRISFPEDILGSLEVDREGKIVGDFQPSGTYRILTNEGILGISPFLREKLVQRLREEERGRNSS